ncbi:uncharacterized protein TNCV_4938261 [Trichonephila clavipes]|nr:uncharacterized protein TNCV_4938261 [Trichonephila clavipes]
MNELNTRFVYGLRLIGRGVSAGRKVCAVLNLPPFLSKLAFRQQEKKLLSATISIGEKIMNDAAKGIRQLKKSIHGTVNCGVSVDGTWQRRGFSSLNGCVSSISVDTGKSIDLETLSQFVENVIQRRNNKMRNCSVIIIKDFHPAWNRLGLIVFLRGRKIIECYDTLTIMGMGIPKLSMP